MFLDNSYLALCTNSIIEKKFLKLLSDSTIKIVSFDIFETLLFRNTLNHENIFLEIGNNEYIKAIFNDADTFKNFRVAAQQSAHKRTKKEAVTFEDIYNEFSYLTNEQRLKIMNIEKEIENSSLFVNPQVERWLTLANEYNKKIILISDMYFDFETIHKITVSKLQNQDLIDKVYVSSEFNKTKHTGSLYLEVLSHYKIKPDEMLHIGDNLRTDYAMAHLHNIHTLLYKSSYYVRDMLTHEGIYTDYCEESISSRRVLSSILNPYEDRKQEFFYNFGSLIGGPLLHSFTYWVLEIAKKHNITQIYSIMREGRIFNKYLHKIFIEHNIPISLHKIYASRVSTYLLTLDENDFDIKNTSFFNFRKLTVDEFYKIFKLDVKHPVLQEVCSTFLSELSTDILEKIKMDLNLQKENIKTSIQAEKKLFRQYLDELNITKDSVIIDFGGSGSVQGVIADIFKDDFTILNLLFYISEDAFEKRISTKVFPFLPLYNETLKQTRIFRRSPDIFELLFNGMEATTTSYQVDNNQISPILGSEPPYELNEIIEAFDAGIDAYFTVFKAKGYDQTEYDGTYLVKLLARVIDYPTQTELDHLGNLPLELNYHANNLKEIIAQEHLNFLQTNNIQTVMNRFYADTSRYYDELPWPQGSAAKLHINYLLQSKYVQRQTINDAALANILVQIDRIDSIKSLSVYGTGEFFLLLLPELLRREIQINYLIDSKAETNEYLFFNFQVISPHNAVALGENIFIIASVAFASEIGKKLQNISKDSMVIMPMPIE